MSRRIKTRIGRIYKNVLSMTVVQICRAAGRTPSDDHGDPQAPGSMNIQGRVMIKESGRPGNDRPALNPLTLFSRVLGAFPLPDQPIDPAISIEILAYSYRIKKEAVPEFIVKCITTKPSGTHPEWGVERFSMSGLDRPRAAFSLARDDLDAIAA